jgi:hypothetical protein
MRGELKDIYPKITSKQSDVFIPRCPNQPGSTPPQPQDRPFWHDKETWQWGWVWRGGHFRYQNHRFTKALLPVCSEFP